jgi:hypothetical protein
VIPERPLTFQEEVEKCCAIYSDYKLRKPEMEAQGVKFSEKARTKARLQIKEIALFTILKARTKVENDELAEADQEEWMAWVTEQSRKEAEFQAAYEEVHMKGRELSEYRYTEEWDEDECTRLLTEAETIQRKYEEFHEEYEAAKERFKTYKEDARNVQRE